MGKKVENKLAISLALEPKNFVYQDTELKKIIYVVHGGRTLYDINNGQCNQETFRMVMQTVSLYNQEKINFETILDELDYQQSFEPDPEMKILLSNNDYEQALKRMEVLKLMFNN